MTIASGPRKLSSATNRRIALGLAILLLAAFFRLRMLEQVPPGLQHDEIFNAEDAVKLATQGDFRLYYPINSGREGAFIWVLAASYKLFGANLIMIKFPSAVFGLLTVALLYRFGCGYFSLTVGSVAGGMTAVSFWAVFYSRVGLRAVMLPVVVLLALIFLAPVFNARTDAHRRRSLVLAGIALGFAVYTYTSALALYLAFALLVIVALALRRLHLRRHLLALLTVGAIAAAIALPLVYSRLSHPGGLRRAVDIILPLQAAEDGDFSLVLTNALRLAGAPALVGDPTWRYNVAGRPLFLLPIGLLAYLGLAFALMRARRAPLNIFLIGLALLGLVPSLITLQAPSFIRILVIMPCLMLFIGLAVSGLGSFFSKPIVGWALALVVVAATAIADYHAYFVEWASSQKRTLPYHNYSEQGDIVHEIYRDDMQQLADYLQDSDAAVAAVSTPNKELDPFLYAYAGGAVKVNTHVVFFHALFNIALSRQPMLLFVSPLSPVSEKQAHWLTVEYGARRLDPVLRQDGELAFDVYELSSRPEPLLDALDAAAAKRAFVELDGDTRELQFPVRFGDLLLLRGIELPEHQVYGENYGVHNQLYVEPLRASDESIQFFMHLISPQGERVAQRDYLGVPTAHWHPDVLFMQDHFVPFYQPVPAGVYHLYFGVYNWQSGQRIPIVDDEGVILADRLHLGEITVIDRPD